MTRRTLKTATTLGRKAMETAMAAPQVVAHRVGRMATAGAHPSRRDQTEFAGMVAEKQQAFMQSAAVSVAEKGLAPVHRKAVSNAKRLSKVRR